MTEFKVYPKQQAALMSNATEILYGGAAGGGKSHLVRVAAIVYSLAVPGLLTYIFRRTFKEVLSNHVYTPGGFLELLKDMIDSKDVVFSKSDYSFTFSNGSRIQLAHAQYESDVYLYQGAQFGFLIIDEATHFPPSMIRYLRSRVRIGNLKIPAKYKAMFPRILYTSNPGGVGHHYFKSNFVDHGSDRQFRAPEDEGSMLREYIPAKLADNIVLTLNDPEYANRLKGLGDAAIVNALLNGDWDLLSSGGFADVWRSKFHVIPPFDIPHSWYIDRGYDYGSSNPAAALWFAESDGTEFIDGNGKLAWVPKGTIFQISELYFANAKYEGLRLDGFEQGRRIKMKEADEGIGWRCQPGPADNAIFSSEPGQATVSEMMARSGIIFTRGNKNPGSRVNGVQEFRRRLDAGTKRPLENPAYFIFNTCYHTIRTIPNLENDEKNREDIDTSGEDHIWDVIRYRVLKSAKTGSSTKVSGA